MIFLHAPGCRYISHFVAVLFLCGLIHSCVLAQSQGNDFQSLVTMLGNDAPYSFPEKIVVGAKGDIYILDTELSNVFINKRGEGQISPLCAPRLPTAASDISIDVQGNVWVLDARGSKIIKLNSQCSIQIVIDCHRRSMELQANSIGEIIALAAEGDTLFDMYSANGKYLRSFGQRNKYEDSIADAELNDGHLVSDRSGGFFFSFNYPSLVQHYARSGRLLTQFKPESNINIEPPDVSARMENGMLQVRSRYQILVLDVALDARGRLILLMSGQNKAQALTQGSRNMLVTTGSGRVLRRVGINEAAFNRLAAGPDTLFLLRNRKPLRLDMYPLP